MNISSKVSDEEFGKRKSGSDLENARHFRPWTRCEKKSFFNNVTKDKNTENNCGKNIAAIKQFFDPFGDCNQVELKDPNNQTKLVKVPPSKYKFESSLTEEYTIVAIHIETFKSKNSPDVDLCQIGCSVVDINSLESFFRPIKPNRLHQFLNNYKMEGDLLKALHMVHVDTDIFEFREKMEEIKDEQDKQFCVSEENALKDLIDFLKQFKNCILFAIDEETIKLIHEKTLRGKIRNDVIKGFFTWANVLTKFIPAKSGMELEDFYSDFCTDKIKSYSSASDVSSYLKKAFFRCVELSIPSSNIVKSLNGFNQVLDDNKISNDLEENDTIEVFNSFRPSVSTKMGAMKIDTLEISSDSDDDQTDKKIGTRGQRKVTQESKLKQFRPKMPGLPDGIKIQPLQPNNNPFLNPNIRVKGVANVKAHKVGFFDKSSKVNNERDEIPTVRPPILLTNPGLTISRSPHLPGKEDKTFRSQKSRSSDWNQSLLNRLSSPSASKQTSQPLSLGEKIGNAFQNHITRNRENHINKNQITQNRENHINKNHITKNQITKNQITHNRAQTKMFKCGLCFYKTALKEDLELHWRFNCRGGNQASLRGL